MITFLIFVLFVLLGAAAGFGVARVGLRKESPWADEIHMVTTPDLWNIRLCRYKAKRGPGEPIFLCHGFMANQFNFALPAGKGMVDFLSEAGYDCWAIDLRGNLCTVPPFGRKRGEPTIDDYLLKDIPAAIDYIRKHTGYARVHWIGHSMGGMLLYAYDAAVGSDLLASATTMGSPLDFQGVPFKEPKLLMWLRLCSGTLFRAFGRLLTMGLVRFRPNNPLVPFNWDNMDPKCDSLALYGAFEAPPIPVARALSYAASNKVLRVKNGEVDVVESLKNIHVPLFAMYGAADPFVPIPNAEAFINDMSQQDKRILVLSKENGHAADYSHVDMAMGRDIKADVCDPIVEWLAAHPIHDRISAIKEVSEVEKVSVVTTEAVAQPVETEQPAPAKKARARKPRADAETAKTAKAAPRKKASAVAKAPTARKKAAKSETGSEEPKPAPKRRARKPKAESPSEE